VDFFEAQQHARGLTFRLVLLFCAAVVSLVVLTNLLLMAFMGWLNSNGDAGNAGAGLAVFDWGRFWLVGIGVVSVIGIASLVKIASLSRGGANVAEMMGGHLLLQGGTLPEKRILNVVEEMAIASGTPVPPVYLIEEPGINAFAAGFSPSDAVIGITQGAIDSLDRDQLQGVIGHEFSHILNGDMRLNIRLIGILHGILVIGMVGYFLLRYAPYSNRRSKNDSSMGIVALGLGLTIIGYAGTFFGKAIKASVSRQREFLADASAVQFTRNPDGIAGALEQIGVQGGHGSLLQNPHASEISHALFATGMAGFVDKLFATHPPLQKRIRAIKPGWDGLFHAKPSRAKPEEPPASETFTATRQQKAAKAFAAAVVLADQASTDQVGRPGPAHLQSAAALKGSIPKTFSEAARVPHSARVVLYCLVLNRQAEARKKQLRYLRAHADHGVFPELLKLASEMSRLPRRSRLALIEMSLPALRQLSDAQYALFKDNLKQLVIADEKIELFEWSLYAIVTKHLDRVFLQRPRRPPRKNLKQLTPALEMLLSTLVDLQQLPEGGEQQVFRQAAERLGDLPSRNCPGKRSIRSVWVTPWHNSRCSARSKSRAS